MKRIVIAGAPRCGKTTRALELARQHGAKVRHTDDLIGKYDRDRDGEAQAVARWLDEPGPLIVEGVTAARGLRRWLQTHPYGKPCDEVLVMRRPLVALNDGQRAMAKGCETVWQEIAPVLKRRGVQVVERWEPSPREE